MLNAFFEFEIGQVGARFREITIMGMRLGVDRLDWIVSLCAAFEMPRTLELVFAEVSLDFLWL